MPTGVSYQEVKDALDLELSKPLAGMESETVSEATVDQEMALFMKAQSQTQSNTG